MSERLHAAQSEKDVQRDVVKLFRSTGCVVCSLSQPRRTMQAEGLPDLWVFCVRKQTAFWFEVKKPGERLRTSQAAFREHCLLTGTPHFWGGMPEAVTVLRTLGIVAA